MGLTTFSTALSGLSTNSQGLNVVGNNLANLNTVGFKTSSIAFVDVLGQTFSTSGTATSGNIMSIGLGSQVSSVRQAMSSQGTIQSTNSPLDVAIQGKGFLVVKNNNGQFYTRAGNLHLDANGFVVSDNGSFVQGYTRNPATNKVDSNLGLNSIHLPSGIDSPFATTLFEVAMNLDANAADGSQFTTSIQVYDSIGKAHVATVTLQKEITGGSTPSTKWRFDITIPNNEIAGVASTNTDKFSLITGGVVTGAPTAGALQFDNTGKLTSAWIGTDPSTPPPLADITFPAGTTTLPALADGGVLNPTMTWRLLADPSTPDVTGYATPSEVSASNQDGGGAGALTNFAIGPDGMINAIFSNGKVAQIAQLVLASFANVDGLIPEGGGLYSETIASGASTFGAPGEGGRGTLLSSALEQSNVDLAAELTKIITFQRGYQANARMVTVTDQIMQETMNMRQ